MDENMPVGASQSCCLTSYLMYYVFGAIASVVGVGFVFTYSLTALINEYNVGATTVIVNETTINGTIVPVTVVIPECASMIKDWVIFICVWSGISIYLLLQQSKSSGDGNEKLQSIIITTAIVTIMSLGFFLGSYFKYWKQFTCLHTHMNNAVYVFMLYELAVCVFNFVLITWGVFAVANSSESSSDESSV